MLSALLAAIVVGGILIEMLSTIGIVQHAQRFQESGASVVTIQSPGSIDGATCEALNKVDGVRAAGAIRPYQVPLSPETLPNSGLVAFETTPTLPKLLNADGQGPGIFLSEAAASSLGLVAGSQVTFKGDATTFVGGVFPWREGGGRRPGFGFSAVVPIDARSAFDECWLDIWPSNDQAQDLLRLTLLRDDAVDPPKITLLNSTLGASFDGAEQFRGRPSRWASIGVLVTAGTVGFAASWRRRLEVASDLHVGVLRADLLLKHLAEVVVSAGIGVTLAFPVATLLVQGLPVSDRPAAFGLAACVAAVGACAMLLGAATALTLARESAFLHYFRNR